MPIFETAVDRKNESVAAEGLSKAFGGLEIKSFEPVYGLDVYGEYNGSKLFVAEIKCRKMYWGEYSTIYLSKAKYKKLMSYKDKSLCQLFVVYTLTDGGLYALDVKSLNLDEIPLCWGGRTSQPRKGAPNDTEWIYDVPLDKFIKL